jgi:glycosyltransferase involved in cell wall biosynthesis
MKITILTQYYPPEHGAPQNRLHDLARRWVEAGEEVVVLTAMPNYPRGEVFEEYRGKLISTEEIDGVKVIHSAIFVSKKKSMIAMLSIYFSFVFTSIIAGILKLGKSDVLLCESPPLFLGFSALVLKFWTRSKLVMNISDLWPESAVQLGLIGKGPTLSALEFFERLLYKSSKLVSCQTDGIVNGVKKSHKKAETFLFPNGVDLEMFQPQPKDESLKKEFDLPDGYFVVGYGGNHGRSQALSQVLEAATRLKDEKIIFVLFGDGPEKPELQEKAKEMGLVNVRFYPSQPRQKMSKIQSLWDLALAPLKNIDIFDGARPSKMFELMAGEIPFIFCGKGEGADIALESGAAKVAPPESYDDLAEIIKSFAEMTPEQRKEMGKQGRKFVSEKFDRSKLAVEFLEKLKDVLKK